MNQRCIFYATHAPEDFYAILRRGVPPGFRLLTLETNDDDERRRLIAEADAVIVAPSPLSAAVAAAGTRVRLLQHFGVGWHGMVPEDWMRANGVRLSINPHGTVDSVSEHALALILACLRFVPRGDAALRRGEWLGTALRPIARNLHGMTVGIVGMGRIGSAVAALLQPFKVRGNCPRVSSARWTFAASPCRICGARAT